MSHYRMHRGWMENDVFDKNEPFDRRSAWIWLIENARFMDNCELRRAQLKISGRKLAEEWQWSLGRVQRFLADLACKKMIERLSESPGTLITICNYDKYQAASRLGESLEDESPIESPGESPVSAENEATASGYTTVESFAESHHESVNESPYKTKNVKKEEGKKERGDSDSPTETPLQESESSNTPDYAFSGCIIKLLPRDFEIWQERFRDTIPDLRAALTSLDAWYEENLRGEDRKRWFLRSARALEKRHQKLLSERKHVNAHGVAPLPAGGG